ncbi:Hypp5357 [Branchiostoma lanceolatum]|uniref:Hypp5357 protein n=1 Tax=Branchiostoma lanceolatum TaxID=7740 RepID=A0A8J9Z5Y0_BRALA|nr:Hypp7607 [Branchiostoma lanceolatum]CAH1248383.1 Hypp8117 [Branchiostoma lanceolatum]CAH1274661.1 Hypp5357 [Branchiostoma lanceolatum]
METLLTKLEELKTENATNFTKLNEKIDDMKSDMKKMGDVLCGHEEKLKFQDELIKNLQEKIESLEARQFHSEQYSRKNCLRVWGFPDNYDQRELPAKFADFAQEYLHVKIMPGEIDNIHYLGAKGSRRHIIVKFSTFLAKRKVYEARKALKGKKNGAGSFISVRPDLSPASRALFHHAKQLVSNGTDNKPLSAVWVTIEGRIWATRGDRRVLLTSRQDLEQGVAADIPGEQGVATDIPGEFVSQQRRKFFAKRQASQSPELQPEVKKTNVFEPLAQEVDCP